MGIDIKNEESQKLEFAVQLAKKGFKIIIRDKLTIINQLKLQYGSLFQYKVI